MTSPDLPSADDFNPGLEPMPGALAHGPEMLPEILPAILPPVLDGAAEPIPHFLTPPADLELGITGEFSSVAAPQDPIFQGAARFLAEASAILASSLDYEATLATVARLAVPFLADYCVVDIVDARTQRIRRVATAHADPRQEPLLASMREYPPQSDGDGVVARVLRSGKSEVIPEIDTAALERDVDPRAQALLAIVRQLEPTSYMCVPLVAHGAVGGAMLLVATRRTGRHFTGAHRRVAEELARRAALAVDNARLYAAEREARLRAERLRAATVGFAQSLTEEEVVRVALQSQMEALQADAGSVWLIEQRDGEAGLRRAFHSGTAPEAIDGNWLPLGRRTPLTETVHEGKPHAGTALVTIPIAIGGRTLGVLGCNFNEAHEPSDEELAVAWTLATQCAQALERARLFAAERQARDEAEQATRRVAFLARVSSELASSLEVNEMLQRVAELAVPEIADWCFVELYEGLDPSVGVEKLLPAVVHHADAAKVALGWRAMREYPLKPENPYGSAVVAKSGETLLVVDIPPEVLPAVARDAEHLRILQGCGFRSSLQVPLRLEDRTVGVLTFAFAESDRRYEDADRWLAEEIATRCSVALAHAQLYALAQNSRREAEAALAVAERASRAKSEFLAVVSHELRTPLNAIGGYVQLLAMGLRGPLTVEQQGDLQRINRAQGALRSLIDDVLDFSRLEAGRMEYRIDVVDIPELLATAEAVIAPLTKSRGLELHVADAPPVRVRADQRRVQQILINLLTNAVKFTGPGGSVSLECGRKDEQLVEFRVRDSGRGIHPAEFARIFEPFEQGDVGFTREAGGVGLGLAISRRLAREMGGELRLDHSTLGGGSVFCLELPAELP